MLADIHGPVTSGQITGPEIDASIITVVGCVEQVLIDFSDKYTNSKIKNEKGLTQKLVHMLAIHALREYHPFRFEKEYMEVPERGDSPQVDIAAISTLEEGIVIGAKAYEGESFFSMEAKRLANLGSNRLMEYLIGRFEKGKYKSCGGVERFKQGVHGRKLVLYKNSSVCKQLDFLRIKGKTGEFHCLFRSFIRLRDGNERLVGVFLGKVQVSSVTKPATDKNVKRLRNVRSVFRYAASLSI